jgi:hypothetical protein
MKMDRNCNADGKGKYAVVRLRGELSAEDMAALAQLEKSGRLDWGMVGQPDEFFLIRLKDRFAQDALDGYANAAEFADPEWAAEVRALARRAGPAHPECKFPD